MEVKLYQTPQINFKAMKSSQFKSLEYSAMRKFKAPIEKFNGINDFYSWASHKCKELTSKELGGRNPAIQAKRNAMKQDWVNYIMRVKKLSQPVALMILASIFKGLKPDNSDLLPQLNEDVFERTLND